MLTAAARWGGGAPSDRSCRGRSACCAPSPATRRARAAVPARGRRPGHPAPVRAGARATSCWWSGRSGAGFAGAPRGPLAAAGRRRGRDRSAGDLAGRARRRACAARLPRRGPRRRRGAAARRPWSPPTTAASATTGWSPSCSPSALTPTITSRSTPAARRRCSRRCARSAPARGIPAQLALESGMACGFGACFGCVVPTRDGLSAAVPRRPGARRRRARDRRASPGRDIERAGPLIDFCGIELEHPIINGRARSTRSPPTGRSATSCSSASRSPRSSPRRSRSRRARATRRRGCGSWPAG